MTAQLQSKPTPVIDIAFYTIMTVIVIGNVVLNIYTVHYMSQQGTEPIQITKDIICGILLTAYDVMMTYFFLRKQ